jgi:hypothetical protein
MAHIRVFISYTHDSQEQMDCVWDLSERLRKDGMDCRIDQHEVSPEDGWPRWCRDQIRDSDYVLIVCTETYQRRYEGKEEGREGRGAQWEGLVVTQELYEAKGKNAKFIPVLFSLADTKYIPTELRGATYYDLSEDKNYDGLFRHITNQRARIPSAVAASVRRMPPMVELERKSPSPQGNLSAQNAAEEQRLATGIRNYFEGQEWFSPEPGQVIGLAKGIVERFGSESDVVGSVQAQIERRKKEDPNWTYANRIQSALALVQALGLSARTKEKNRVFLDMVVPAISPKPTPHR